ncbi:uncharacterized protein LOC120515250 [Polypterus senegalus]|uniref:uncharacterized protein LOC120515250 n=1 Tax=Polypterus senegalus TaxID=55291 RepID=UPI00196402E4|nr:uncharacterized protein LOC120515250 [Polypterus senegalus]
MAAPALVPVLLALVLRCRAASGLWPVAPKGSLYPRDGIWSAPAETEDGAGGPSWGTSRTPGVPVMQGGPPHTAVSPETTAAVDQTDPGLRAVTTWSPRFYGTQSAANEDVPSSSPTHRSMALPGQSLATAPAAPSTTAEDVAPTLNIGDDMGVPRQSENSLGTAVDPLVTTVVFMIIMVVLVAAVLYFKSWYNASQATFRHLQDLPMDDTMESVPLARCTY